jgi:hypothetical protein
LVVEVEARVADLAVQIDYRHDRRISAGEMLAEIIERVALRLAQGAVPAEPAGFGIRDRLAGDNPRTVWPRDWPAIKAHRLVETAINAVRALLPP